MKNWFPLLLLLLFASSCNKQYYSTNYQYDYQKINDHTKRNEVVWNQIIPYKDSLDQKMNLVLAVSDTILTKTSGESDLGNFMCDLILRTSVDYFKQPIHFTVLNNGGIRIPNLPKGNITLGKMIELMPFENRIVLMKLNGNIVDSLFQHMASKGGWQVSGARYKIKNGKAVEIEIADTPFDTAGEYTLAISDYLAQGGDNCTMLTDVTYTDSKKTLRDALIEGLLEMNQRGETVKSVRDGRVQLID